MSYFGVGEGDESLMSPGERRGDPWIPVTFSETSIRFRIQYRVLAHAMWASFVTVFVVGAVLTYTVTDYSAKTDMIYRYYESFNPCIFFDHYPANLVGSIGVGAMVMVQASQVAFIALHRFALAAESPKNEQPWSNFMFVPFIGPCMLVYAAFSNTFTASLYAEGYPTLHNSTEYKILHPNSTRDQADGLQAHDVETVVTHSIWFVLYLVADLVFNAFVWSYAARLRSEKSIAWPRPREGNNCCWCCGRDRLVFKLCRWMFGIGYFFGVVVFTGSLFTYVFAYNGNDRFFFGLKNPDAPFLQKFVDWLAKNSKAYLWNPIVICAAPLFAIPDGVGLTVTVSLVASDPAKRVARDETGLSGVVRPSHMLSRSFKLLMILVLLTLVFSHAGDSSGNVSPLAVGFRAKPWAFVFTPVWILNTMGLFWTVSMAIARTYLLDAKTEKENKKSNLVIMRGRRMLSALSGLTIVIFSLLGVWAVIPQVTHSRWIGSTLAVSIPVFMGCITLGRRGGEIKRGLRGAVFYGHWIIALVSGICSTFSIVASVVFVIALALYGDAMDFGCPSMPAVALDVKVVRDSDSNVVESLPKADRVAATEGVAIEMTAAVGGSLKEDDLRDDGIVVYTLPWKLAGGSKAIMYARKNT
jgi:hypothetical protein